MGKYYGSGPIGGSGNDGPPCPNGILLPDESTPFTGTRMRDSMGRVWGCPGTAGLDPADAGGSGGSGGGAGFTINPTDKTNPLDPTGGAGNTAGVWTMPPELQSLYGSLMGKATDILGMPLGFDQQTQDYMFGPKFETLRGTQQATDNALLGNLSRAGMLDTGAGVGMLNQNAWNTQNSISDLMREIFVQNEQQKKSDLLNNTQLASSLFGTGLASRQMEESINAARRGEAMDFWNKLLALLQIYKG